MFDVDSVEIGSSQRGGLRARGSHKFMCGDWDRRDSEAFESYRIVQTARRAGSSIGQSLDNRRAFGFDELVNHRVGRGFGEGRLHHAHDLLNAVAVF